jgi:hypothetical protein
MNTFKLVINNYGIKYLQLFIKFIDFVGIIWLNYGKYLGINRSFKTAVEKLQTDRVLFLKSSGTGFSANLKECST